MRHYKLFIPKKVFIILIFLPFLLYSSNETYNQQIVINLWDKNLKEITEIRKAFEEVAERFNLKVILQQIPEMEIQWEKRKKEK